MLFNQCPIFDGLNQEEYRDMMRVCCSRRAVFKKGDVIFCSGTVTREFGIVEEGSVNIERCDLWGNRMILHNIGENQIFGETYAFSGSPMMADVTAAAHCKIVFLNVNMLLNSSETEKSWYPKAVYNLMVISSNKNLQWSERMLCITSKSIRGRVMNYLSAQAVKTGSRNITVPFDRQQMADYLNVERSALSKELGKMRCEGLIDFSKNNFRLLNINEDMYV